MPVRSSPCCSASTARGVKNLTIIGVGALMIFYVTVGGMKGTTWVQIVKAVLLMAGSALIVVLVLAKFGFNLSDLLGTAASNTGKGSAFLEPGLKYGVDHDQQDRLPVASASPSCSVRPACRTS